MSFNIMLNSEIYLCIVFQSTAVIWIFRCKRYPTFCFTLFLVYKIQYALWIFLFLPIMLYFILFHCY